MKKYAARTGENSILAQSKMDFVNVGKKIVGVGRNYRDPNKPVPEKPILFFKPTTSYIKEGEKIKVPPGCEEVHYEVELGVVLGSTVRSVSESRALQHVAGYAVCLDMTAWHYHHTETSNVQPWALVKGFDTACPVSEFVPKEKIVDVTNLRLWAKKNGMIVQDDVTSNMIFGIEKVISYISDYFTLEAGDLVLTGSPPGSGPVRSGDTVDAGLGLGKDGEDVVSMQFCVE